MSAKYNAYLETDYWKEVAKAVKTRAGFKCQICNSPHDLCAHHRTYEHRGNELQHLSDLICLCRRCHGIFHGKVEMNPPAAQPVKKQDAAVAFVPRLKGEGKKAAVIVRPIVKEEIDALMPEGDGDIILCPEFVDRCRINGAFTTSTIRALGVVDMKAGWVSRLSGKVISRSHYRAALEGRNIYSKKGAAKFLESIAPLT